MTRPHAESSARMPDEARTKEGFIIDEYSSEVDNLDSGDPSKQKHNDEPRIDALDVPSALTDVEQVDDLAADVDGVVEMPITQSSVVDTVDSGARQKPTDDGEMGLGAEPHTAEELELAAIGDALRGRAAVTRDGEEHGERFLDKPSRADDGENA